MTFINLHNHDEYSQLDGMGTAEQYADRAKFLNQPGIASTNHGNIDGLIKHQRACQKYGVKPILGCELYVVPSPVVKQKGETRGHMIVLVRNAAGWQGLCRLLSRANIEGFYHRPRVGLQWFKELPEEELSGLVFMTACLQSFLKLPEGDRLFNWLGERAEIYIEVMPWPSKEQAEWNKHCEKVSQSSGVHLVATNDTHYVLPGDAKAQEVLLAIQRKAKMSDPTRFKFSHEGLHLRSEREMIRAFHRHGSLAESIYRAAIERTCEIADLCNFTIPKMEINLPKTRFEGQTAAGGTPSKALWWLIEKGVISKSGGWFDQSRSQRVEEEFKIIVEKRFERYFLIVAEFVDWCRSKGILIGPGRGSVGGSLIAYLLGITEVDPIEYGLLFSRFINPDRNDYPDIDLDIEARYRDEARIHLEQEYGRNCVAGVSTFTRMMARGVIRDVARAYEIPLAEVDAFSKTLTSTKEGGVIKDCPPSDFSNKYPEAVDMAGRLEGQVRASGQHPAALIISAEDLTACPRCVIVERDGTRVINWEMEDSEYVGLMKLDALRLETLSIIAQAVESVGIGFKWPDKMDDSKIFKMLSDGHTDGVFQMSGYACKKLCIDMGVINFNDIVAITALSRPGPANSGMTEDYVSRKKGGWYSKSSCPEYEEIVKDTYGVLVYQEQVMRVFTDVAGLSPGLADKIRKVIGKKRDPAEFEPYRIQFLDGCKRLKTFAENEASSFWNGLLEWAQYGFNKSHAVEYSIISYRTAWLKVNYPGEYLAAFLTYGEDGQKTEMIDDAVSRTGLKIATPKIGKSDPVEWKITDGVIYAPFKAINGVGEVDAKKCLTLRPPGETGGLSGFFNLKKMDIEKKGTSLQILLDEVKVFDPDPDIRPADMDKYFSFKFPANKKIIKKSTAKRCSFLTEDWREV